MKKKISCILALMCVLGMRLYAQTPTNLSNVTFGFGAGYSYSFSPVKEYSLSTDTIHALKVENARSFGFVISSVITVRLGKVASGNNSHAILSQKTISSNALLAAAAQQDDNAKWYERFTFNLAINLAEVNNDGLSFNKSVDGGLGLGYSFSDHVQLAAFFDIIRVRQLRQHIVDVYENKPIPKGKDVYTALDVNDNELFTTRPMCGASVKLIYTLPNKQ